jgi:nitronate monooxygenase
MAGGPSTPELTAAVSAAGGFGFVAGGYLSSSQLAAQITATRALSAAPFGVNLFCPSAPTAEPELVASYAQAIEPEATRLRTTLGEPTWDGDGFSEKLSLVCDEAVDVVSFTFGCPRAHEVDELHRAGASVAVTVTSSAEARFADERGADLLVVQGTEAGGHQGSFLELSANETPLPWLLEEIGASVSLPLIASGGIMTGAATRAALARGAIAVALGTAFLCADEAGTSTLHREVLLRRTYEETVVTRAFSGRYARGLRNEFAARYGALAPEAYPELHHLTRPLRAAATEAGDPTIPSFWAGEGWQAVSSEPASQIVARLAAELAEGS